MNPFKSAKIISVDTDPKAYHRSSGGERGSRDFIMSRSQLVEFAHCPSRWRAGYSDEEDTKSTEFGSLLDCLVLTPHKLLECYRVMPETYPCEPTKKDPRTEKPWNRNATHCSEWEEDAIKAGLIPIKKAAVDEAKSAHARLMADEVAAEMIECSQKQVFVMAEYYDSDTKIVVPVKILLDLVPDHEHPAFGKSLADFKTGRTADPGAWPRQVFEHGYHVQAALYIDAYVAATGEDRLDFRHIIQENYAPYEVGRRVLSAEFLELGRGIYTTALRSYCQCLNRDIWPSYDELRGGFIRGWSTTEPELWMINRVPDLIQFQDAIRPAEQQPIEETTGIH